MSDKNEKPIVKLSKSLKKEKKPKKLKSAKESKKVEAKVEKTAVDFLIEEFCDAWPLEMVKFNQDDGGHHIEIFCENSKAEEFRIAFPPKYRGFSTVVIGVDEGWGKS